MPFSESKKTIIILRNVYWTGFNQFFSTLHLSTGTNTRTWRRNFTNFPISILLLAHCTQVS